MRVYVSGELPRAVLAALKLGRWHRPGGVGRSGAGRLWVWRSVFAV